MSSCDNEALIHDHLMGIGSFWSPALAQSGQYGETHGVTKTPFCFQPGQFLRRLTKYRDRSQFISVFLCPVGGRMNEVVVRRGSTVFEFHFAYDGLRLMLSIYIPCLLFYRIYKDCQLGLDADVQRRNFE